MRLYSGLIRFLRVVVHLYFVEVRSSGRDRVPAEGPLILAANHPGSVLDAVLLSTQVSRPIRYLARSGLFRVPMIAALFRSLGAIPVYRPNEAADAGERNQVTFARVFEHLEGGGCIGIFPEGRNSSWAQVGQLRKGVARMALGAEARNDFSLGLVIVPVGINHDQRDLLTSDALLRFGRPIRVADYRQRYAEDEEAAVVAMIEEVQRVLRRQALHIADRRIERMVNDLEAAFSVELAGLLDHDEASRTEEGQLSFARRWVWQLLRLYHRSSHAAGRALEQRILSRNLISTVLSRALENEPRSVLALNKHLDRYKDHLAQTRLRAALTQRFDQPVRERWVRLRMTVFALVMAPVALFGLVHNVVPYLVTTFLPRLFRDEAVRTFAYFGIGVLAFLSSYALFGYWLWQTSQFSAPWIATYLAALPPTGFAALGYRRTIMAFRDKVLLRTVIFDRTQLVELLRGERESLFRRFQTLSERYRD
ncbi:1-acyl-sn-glycerol-3-phosphate acyltransferase [Wenzhouxiangella sp. EGI_FJ10409]|uniref:1-acyl-sn-glycerol-3-phosphate acyltransferase n=1 Tax=Wenzhouxiangella sp. EGI_FJ10409 TaxID=3243767 RepID=UPI0035DFE240